MQTTLTGTMPTIADKLLHLGFQASAADQTVFKRPDLDGLTIKLDEDRLNVMHQDGTLTHEAVLNQRSALNNINLEKHVRGVIGSTFGAEAARKITNFPYSEQRIEAKKAQAAAMIPNALS